MGLRKDLDVMEVFCKGEYKLKEISFKEYQVVKKSVGNLKGILNTLKINK